MSTSFFINISSMMLYTDIKGRVIVYMVITITSYQHFDPPFYPHMHGYVSNCAPFHTWQSQFFRFSIVLCTHSRSTHPPTTTQVMPWWYNVCCHVVSRVYSCCLVCSTWFLFYFDIFVFIPGKNNKSKSKFIYTLFL